jgi:dienelactone hydrolase
VRWTLPFAAWTALVLAGLPVAAAPPEEPGPYVVEQWADPAGTPVPCPAGVYYPGDAPCPGAPVVLVHGAGEAGDYKVVMAQRLASRGLVAVLPSFPNLLLNPDQTDADELNALLAWTVEQGQDPSSPLYDKVDGTAQGLAGHSNGGVVFLAAADNEDVGAVVGWDAVAHLDKAAGLHGSSLHLLAEDIACNGGSTMAYDVAPAPKARATVESSTHCDFDDPESPFCVSVCGTPPWEAAVAEKIERYTVAYLTCVLGHDPAMAEWLDFSAPQQGLTMTAHEGSFACREAECEAPPGETGDGGGETTDGGETAGSATSEEESGASETTGEDPSSGSPASEQDASGCGCRTVGPASAALVLLPLGRRRRATTSCPSRA